MFSCPKEVDKKIQINKKNNVGVALNLGNKIMVRPF